MVPNRTLGFFLSDHDSQDVEKTAQRTNIFFHWGAQGVNFNEMLMHFCVDHFS